MTPGVIQKTFPLDNSILDKSSSTQFEITTLSDKNVVAALLGNDPLPPGELTFGAIDVGASADSIKLQAGPGTVGFQTSAGLHAGLALCNSPDSALQSLQLDTPPGLDLQVGGAPTDRYLCAVFRYAASGSFTGSQPVGGVGTLTFGVSGSAAGLLATIHRFAPATRSQQALGDTFASFRLPRHVTAAGKLAPGTWIVGETEGSLGLQLAAALGYNLNYTRKLNLLGLSRDLSAKIDASVKATFGFTVSGKYLVVVSRADATPNVRLQLFKQAQNGMTFGLNAAVGVQFAPILPQNPDDLVKAVFGVNALQVVNDLRAWTDPNADLGAMAARLGLSEAKDLIRSVTGVDPDTELARGHQLLMDVVNRWHALPGAASAELWNILGKLSPQGAQTFQQALTGLGDPDPAKASAALTAVLQNATFGATPEGQFLGALGAQSILALRSQIPAVQNAAAEALGLLNGGTLAKLQKYIDDKLDLQKVLDATDPAQINNWLQKRLADFFDRAAAFPPLKEVQTAIHTVIGHAQTIYATALQAATNRYSAELAATYQRTATGTALADVMFDMSKPAAAALLQSIMDSGSLDTLFTNRTDGVSIQDATITHEISRNSTVSVHLPYFDSKTEHINDSTASLGIEHDAGSVLVYQLNASDKVKKARYLSQLQIFARIAGGAVGTGSTISYQMLLAQKAISRAELAFRTAPFLRNYLDGLFTGGPSSLDAWYTNLDNTVAAIVHNGANEFGNVLVNMQLTLPATLLNGWLAPLAPADAKAAEMRMSRALQRQLRKLLPLFYFQNLDNLVDNAPAAALLTWAAMPLSTSVSFDPPDMTLNTDKDVYWDWPDDDVRHAMAGLGGTQASLAVALAAAQQRLFEAGLKRAGDFDPQRAAVFQGEAIRDDLRLRQLCFVEATLIDGAVKAFRNLQAASAAAKSDPSTAIEALANAGASLTEAFNKAVSPNYGEDASRTLNSMLLVEATNAIAQTDPLAPDAMLNLIVLNEATTYDMTRFLTGDLPPKTEIALTQSLVSS